MTYTILLIDDEVAITDINQRYLEQAGYRVLVAHDGLEALDIFDREKIDLIITDIMMPRMDGYDFISEVLARDDEQPFLFISAKTSEPDKIYSLSLGADDFISKPFSPRELVLRVHNILRRIYKGHEEQKYLSLGDLQMNRESYEVTISQKMVSFTVKEFDLLWLLVSHPNHVFSKTELYEKVWHDNFMADTNTLNVHIHTLRHHLSTFGTDQTPTIKTVWGLGYKLEKV